MISKELIDEINRLYHKSKAEGLTEEEKEQQSRLRQEYLQAMRARVKDVLDQVKVVDEIPPEDGECNCDHQHKH